MVSAVWEKLRAWCVILLLPADCVRTCLYSLPDPRCRQRALVCADRIALDRNILQQKFHRIHPDLFCKHIDRFGKSDAALEIAKSTICCAQRHIRIHTPALITDIWAPEIGRRNIFCAPQQEIHLQRRVRATDPVCLHADPLNRSVLVCRKVVGEGRLVAERGDAFFAAVRLISDRPQCPLRQDRAHQIFFAGVVRFGAEAAADKPADDLHLVKFQMKRRRDIFLITIDSLAGDIHAEDLHARIPDRGTGVWFERAVKLRVGFDRNRDFVIRLLDRLCRIAFLPMDRAALCHRRRPSPCRDIAARPYLRSVFPGSRVIIQYPRKHPVRYLNSLQRIERLLFSLCRHTDDSFAEEPDPVIQNVMVRRSSDKIQLADERVNAFHLLRFSGIYRQDLREGIRRPQKFDCQHADFPEIDCELCRSCRLSPGVDSFHILPDDIHLDHTPFSCAFASRILFAARRIPSKYFSYPVHLQIFPASASATSCRVGSGFRSRSALAVKVIPGVHMPHWIASSSTNACWIGCSSPVAGSASPSIVSTLLPSHSTVSVEQDSVGFPSTSTVHPPQPPSLHGRFVPVRSSRSRIVSTSVSDSGTSPFADPIRNIRGFPLTVILISLAIEPPPFKCKYSADLFRII